MKSYLPLLSAVLIFASCSTYKSGQTPDDVYFSPQRPTEEYVTMDNKNDKEYRSDDEYRDDQYLRMKVQNRRWSALDDDWYSYNPSYYYSLNNSLYYNNPYNYNPYISVYHGFGNYNGLPYYNYYNPYYTGIVTYVPATPVYNKPRRFNLNSYNPPAANNNYGHGTRSNSTNTSGTNSNYRGSGSNAGQFLRNIFNNSGSNGSSNSSNNSTNSSSSRSTSSPSSSGSSNSGSSSGHSSVRRF